LPAFQKLARMLVQHLDGILNSCPQPATCAAVDPVRMLLFASDGLR